MVRLGVVKGQNRVSFLRLIRLLGFPLQCQPLNIKKADSWFRLDLVEFGRALLKALARLYLKQTALQTFLSKIHQAVVEKPSH